MTALQYFLSAQIEGRAVVTSGITAHVGRPVSEGDAWLCLLKGKLLLCADRAAYPIIAEIPPDMPLDEVVSVDIPYVTKEEAIALDNEDKAKGLLAYRDPASIFIPVECEPVCD